MEIFCHIICRTPANLLKQNLTSRVKFVYGLWSIVPFLIDRNEIYDWTHRDLKMYPFDRKIHRLNTRHSSNEKENPWLRRTCTLYFTFIHWTMSWHQHLTELSSSTSPSSSFRIRSTCKRRSCIFWTFRTRNASRRWSSVPSLLRRVASSTRTWVGKKTERFILSDLASRYSKRCCYAGVPETNVENSWANRKSDVLNIKNSILFLAAICFPQYNPKREHCLRHEQ